MLRLTAEVWVLVAGRGSQIYTFLPKRERDGNEKALMFGILNHLPSAGPACSGRITQLSSIRTKLPLRND